MFVATILTTRSSFLRNDIRYHSVGLAGSLPFVGRTQWVLVL